MHTKMSLHKPFFFNIYIVHSIYAVKFLETSWNPIRRSINRISEIPIQRLCTKDEIYSYLKPIRMSEKMRLLLTNSAVLTRPGADQYESLQYEGRSSYMLDVTGGSCRSMLRWTFDIEVISETLSEIQDFPDFENSFGSTSFLGRVLIIRADPKKSFYVQDSDIPSKPSFEKLT